MKIWTKRWVKLTGGLLITLIALWLSFRNITWSAFFQILSEIHWGWVALAVSNVIFSVYIMGWRWKILLSPKANFSMMKLFRLNMISQYWNIVLPARAGDVVKAYLISKEKAISGGFGVGTVVLEKLFDFFVFGVLVLTVPFFVAVEKNWWPALPTSLFVLVIFIFSLGIILWRPGYFLKLALLFSRILPPRFRQSISDFLFSGIESLAILKNPQVMLSLILFSFCFVAIQALSNYLVFLALGLKLSVAAALVVLLTLQVVNIPPSSPGKIGVFEYVVIMTLAFYGVGKTEALGYAILLHLVVYLPKIVGGGIMLVGQGGSLEKSQ